MGAVTAIAILLLSPHGKHLAHDLRNHIKQVNFRKLMKEREALFTFLSKEGTKFLHCATWMHCYSDNPGHSVPVQFFFHKEVVCFDQGYFSSQLIGIQLQVGLTSPLLTSTLRLPTGPAAAVPEG